MNGIFCQLPNVLFDPPWPHRHFSNDFGFTPPMPRCPVFHPVVHPLPVPPGWSHLWAPTWVEGSVGVAFVV